MQDLQKVLVIDDDSAVLTMSKAVLESDGYQVEVADTGTLGLELIPQFQPHLILLDINMPELDGLETLDSVRRLEDYVSVIFVSAESEVENVVKGLDKGADDYIRKPYDPRELLARVRAQLRIKKLRDELRQVNERLQDLVNLDELTGLYNMRSIYERLDQELYRGERYGRSIAAIMMDMDGFKSVNDNFDHLFGSQVLKEVGAIIAQQIRKVDFAARYGGDEFLIILTESDSDGAKIFCQRLREQIENYVFTYENHSIELTASIGVAVSPPGQNMDARELVRSADRALYMSKENGRNCIHFYDAERKEVEKI